ncbi:hypothetical protein QX776_07785 [Alteromonadaceae bacterium BrNp21-10]|nr:hypothetical protein [Alteromonadaceae bacterium BrNp21-10]
MTQFSKRLCILATVLTTVGLSGCATSILDKLDFKTPDYSQLYLRGVFTWWEADEAYRVIKVTDTLYKASTKLVADGQPYEFKFVDKEWSEDLNCGYADKEMGEILQVNTPVIADCDGGQNNFKFTPEVSGEYTFFIDFEDSNNPLVYIK